MVGPNTRLKLSSLLHKTPPFYSHLTMAPVLCNIRILRSRFYLLYARYNRYFACYSAPKTGKNAISAVLILHKTTGIVARSRYYHFLRKRMKVIITGPSDNNVR